MLRHNDNTISSMRRLLQELESTRRRGYAVDDEEEEIGMRCVGSAVINKSGQPECAISLVGRVDEISNESLAAFAALIRTAAAKVSERLSPSSSATVTEAATSAIQH
jgi:IclR family acetate operon transcriptional repressor